MTQNHVSSPRNLGYQAMVTKQNTAENGIRQNIRPFLLAGDVGRKGAGLFRSVPLKLKDKDRGKEPHRSKEEYPWFCCEKPPGTDPAGGQEFVGARWNNVHLSLEKKRQAHEKSFNNDGETMQD